MTADSLYAFLDNGFFQTPKYAYHILGAGMLMYVLLNSQRMQKIFSSPVLVFLGKISYSLYLVHFLVISTLTCALFLVLHPVLPYGAAVLISCVLSVLVIIPLSYLFYRYVDMRGIKLSKVFYNQLASIFRPISAGNITQNYLSNAIFTIYNKLFK